MIGIDFETSRLLHLFGLGATIAGLIIALLATRRQAAFAAVTFGVASLLLTAEAIMRTLLTQRAPVVGTYENTLVVAALLTAATTLVLALAAPAVRLTLARLVSPWAIIALSYGWSFSASPLPIGAEGRGALAYAHAFVGWIDLTVLVVGAMAAVGMLLHRNGDSDVWQPLVSRSLGAGFTLLTTTMASGSLLSFAVFGSWYQWQIAETLAAALWLAYGFLLHAYLLFGWRDRRLAVLVLSILPLALAAFWSWSVYEGTYHFFERVLGS